MKIISKKIIELSQDEAHKICDIMECAGVVKDCEKECPIYSCKKGWAVVFRVMPE